MNNECSTLVNNDTKYKVVFLGDAAVGKTSLVEYIMYGTNKPIYQPTICLQSAKKMIMHNNQVYKLMLWDTAGQQKFNSLIPSFVRGYDCAIIVYDVTNKDSLNNCEKWLKMLRDGKNQQSCSIILVGNKADLERNIRNGEGFDLALKNRLGFVEVSARTGQGIQHLVSQIVEGVERFKCKSQKQTQSSEGETSKRITITSKTYLDPEIKMKKSSACCSI